MSSKANHRTEFIFFLIGTMMMIILLVLVLCKGYHEKEEQYVIAHTDRYEVHYGR